MSRPGSQDRLRAGRSKVPNGSKTPKIFIRTVTILKKCALRGVRPVRNKIKKESCQRKIMCSKDSSSAQDTWLD